MKRCCDLEGIARFSDRADVYARARPSYPAAAIAFVRRNATRILDTGSGTGISTALLGAIAVEPNRNMLLATAPTLPRVQGRAEELPFLDRSVDLVTAFNAFHWFQPEAFFMEVRRVLRPNGRLALVWNDWDLRDAFTSEFVQLMRSCAPPDFPPEDREAEVAPLYATRHFTEIERAEFPHRHRLDRELLAMRLFSMSYVTPECAERAGGALHALFDRYAEGGFADHCYFASAFVARVAG